MLITCNECDTRFNIDESLLEQTGSKVRCSKCKNVFLAYPSSFSEKPDKSSEVETELEAVLAEEIESGVQYKAEEKSERIEFAADEVFEKNTEIEKKPEETSFDLDLESEIDETQAETEAELEIKIDVETEDKETETKIEENKTEKIDKDIIHKKDAAEKTEDEEEASKAFNMGTISYEQEAEKSTAITDKIEGSIIADESLSKVAANKRINMPVLFLLLTTLLIGGAYGTYVLLDRVGINLPFVSDALKPEVQDAGNLEIYTSDINNKFVENSKIGKLLVITGKAQNGYSDARSYISITGKLYTKGKILSQTKTVYCGTILSELDLMNMDLDVINNRLSNRLGDNKSNIKVKKGSIIPFMIVFADLPENLDEFTIEVAESFPS